MAISAGAVLMGANTYVGNAPNFMLFVDAKGRIVNIRERAVPGSLDTIPAAGPVRATIELNGGTAARLGIKPGDKVVHPIFGTAD